jgi:subtilisin family serine protease
MSVCLRRFFLTCLVFEFLLLSNSAEYARARASRTAQQGATFQTDRSIAPKYVPGQIFVRFKPGVSELEIRSIHGALNTTRLQKAWAVDGLELVSLAKGVSVEDAVQQYKSNLAVLYAEPNYIVHALNTPNDPRFSEQWNLQNTGQNGGTTGADIRATQAWTQTTGSSGVVVAVLDTGVDYLHPDLAANVWTAPVPFTVTRSNGATIQCPAGSRGFNDVDGSCDPMDDNGHGTHVAGIIGAAGNNGTGVAGVNWHVQIVPCKFLNANGSGSVGGAIACLDMIRTLRSTGINIVASNNSWGGFFFSQALADAINTQRQEGVLFVVAAGNDFSNNNVLPTFPANITHPNVISVASSTRFDDLSSFSNFGRRTVHLAAPGGEILSTTPKGTYSTFSGTSMAAPHVTGVIALLAAQNPARDWRTLRNLVLAGGDSLPGFAQTVTGRRLNAYGSISCANQTVQTRLSPVADIASGAVGQPFVISALNIDCEQPAGSVTVSVSPGNQSFTLVDDGTGTDIASGDGIYTGQFTPATNGSFTLSLPWGEAVQLNVLFNYGFAAQAPNYELITGTNLDLGDDDVATIAPPFPIHFGGGIFSTLFVNANGTVSVTDGNAGYVNRLIPQGTISSFGLPDALTIIAPFWQDLFPVRGTAQNVFWEVFGTAPNRKLVIEWRDVRSFSCRSDANATVKFQVVFAESSDDVTFHYADAQFGGKCVTQDFAREAVVGIQESLTAGQMYSYYLPAVGNASSIEWSLPAANPPPNPAPTLTSINPSSALLNGPGFTLTVTGTNFTPASRIRYGGLDHGTTYLSSTQLSTQILDFEVAQNTAPSQQTVAVYTPAPGGGVSNQITLTLMTPVPVITSISPSSVSAGHLSFSLDLYGSGFLLRGGEVRWNGSLLQSFAVDTTHLRAAVPYTLVGSPGTAQITVTNLPPGGGTSNAVTFTINPAPPASAPGENAATKRLDFAGSGNTDALTSKPMRFVGWNYGRTLGPAYMKYFARGRAGLARPEAIRAAENPSPSKATRLNTETVLGAPGSLPGFAVHKPLPADFIPTGVATGDFNRDGKVDWAVCHGGSDTVWIYLGNGDGTSQLPRIIHLKGSSPIWISAVDLRGNGTIDLVVAEADSGAVGVLLGNGDGTFAPEVLYGSRGPAISLATGDFNGDGHTDVVAGIIGDEFTGPLAFLPGDGTGKLGPPTTRPTQSLFGFYAVFTLDAADLNGDGRPDLVAVDQGALTGAFAYLNRGDGTFKRSQFLLGAGEFISPLNAVAGDVNEDGCKDVVVSTVTAAVFIYKGTCDGSFEEAPNVLFFGMGEATYGLAVADLDGDGHMDVVGGGVPLIGDLFGEAAGNLVSVLRGNGNGTFQLSRVYRGAHANFSLTVADLNGDGKPEVLAANQDEDTLSVFVNDGQGGFAEPAGSYLGYATDGVSGGPINAPFTTFIARDVNGDGQTDLVLIEFGLYLPIPFQVTALLNDGTGKFGSPIRSDAMEYTDLFHDFTLAELRTAGLPDLLILGSDVNQTQGYLWFSPNHGDGNFGPAKRINIPGGPGNFGIGDFDGDGKLDVVVGRQTSTAGFVNELLIMLGNGDGTFRTGTIMPWGTPGSTPAPPRGFFVGDYNADGKTDLLVYPSDNVQGPNVMHPVYLFLGRGDGTFQSPTVAIPHVNGLTVRDVNHDGRLDVIALTKPFDLTDLEFTVFLGQLNGTFQQAAALVPFPGTQPAAYVLHGPTPFQRWGPLLADFNADGNVDIAAFLINSSSRFPGVPSPLRLQIALGMGDGTFTPNNLAVDLGESFPAPAAADLNGDGRDDLVQLNRFVSSFHVIPAMPGSSIEARLVANPVIGSTGSVQLNFGLPLASATTVQLTSSDPEITVPASVTVPAGSVTFNVSFTIGAGFDSSRVFSIQATRGTDLSIVYGTQATSSSAFGYRIFLTNTELNTPPGGTTSDYILGAISINGYNTTVQFTCQGLPAGASCIIGKNPLAVFAGTSAQTSLKVQTSISMALGSYPFTILATDGVVTDQIGAKVNIPDFSLALTPASVDVAVGSLGTLNLDLNAIFGWTQAVNLSCQVTPPGPACSGPPFAVPGATAHFTLDARSATAGIYTVTITGTAGTTTRSVSAQLRVQDVSATFSSTSATISIGSSANFTLTLNSVQGMSGQYTFGWQSTHQGLNGSFNPATASLTSGGSVSTVFTLSVTRRPTMLSPRDFDSPVPPWLWILVSAATGILVFMSVASLAKLPRKFRIPAGAAALVVIVAGILTFAACGGGGGSSGPSTPPPPPNPQPSTTVTVTILATSPNHTKTLGTLTITVP